MNLLFLWDKAAVKQYENFKGYTFSGKYSISYEKGKLSITPNKNYVEGLYGSNIANVMAVVGENGAGKTRLLERIIDVVCDLKRGNTEKGDYFVIFEIDDKVIVYAAGKCFEKLLKTQKPVDISLIMIPKDKIDRQIERTFLYYKPGYFNETLTYNDYAYYRRGSSFYNASVGGLIRKEYNDNYEMHYFEGCKREVVCYFDEQMLMMINFLYSNWWGKDKVKEKQNEFRKPEYILIQFNNAEDNDQYIEKELDKLAEKRKDENTAIENIKSLLGRYKAYFQRKSDWFELLMGRLFMNLFKELCIPQTTAQKTDNELKIFYKVLTENEGRLVKSQDSIALFRQILKLLSDYEECRTKCKKYDIFAEWIEKNKVEWKEYAHKRTAASDASLRIPVIPEEEKRITTFLQNYSNTKFPFPYLRINFGMSSGEFDLLNLFAKMYKMFTENATNDKSILLLLDETELTMHPEWQRRYVELLVWFLHTWKDKYKFQVILTTHSPILLSDIQTQDVLYLERGKAVYTGSESGKKTFGSNIYDLYRDSFFLNREGTMGAFADQQIKKLIDQLKGDPETDQEQIKRRIDMIGDELIRLKLEQFWARMKKGVEVERLRRQNNELKRRIEELEK